ncbi:glycosyltransferase family 4 protein [Polynucleobacter paneuropaeus]|nr:glycosyltransferase family 4 protein [Polynucleobacter paneuropaeus]
MINLLKNSEHEILVVLNAAFRDTSNELLARLSLHMEPENIYFFSVVMPTIEKGNLTNLRASEVLREHFIASLKPDVVYLSTLMGDGWGDSTVVSINALPGVGAINVATHYDLIPLAFPDEYLGDQMFRDYYYHKLESLKKADLLLGISEFTCQEVSQLLNVPDLEIRNISAAVDPSFSCGGLVGDARKAVLIKYKINKKFIFYAPGGFDPRKNLNRLLEAFSQIPLTIRNQHQLVIASKISKEELSDWNWKIESLGLSSDDVVFTGYVSDEELTVLLSECLVYIFPSLHEGFGLPILEAMACGAAVIGSNASSIPEVIGMPDALFDPHSIENIYAKLFQALVDEGFLERLREHSKKQFNKFSWDKSASIALSAIEGKLYESLQIDNESCSRNKLPGIEEMKELLKLKNIHMTDELSKKFEECFSVNQLNLKK